LQLYGSGIQAEGKAGFEHQGMFTARFADGTEMVFSMLL
jgi:hypothetical protein